MGIIPQNQIRDMSFRNGLMSIELIPECSFSIDAGTFFRTVYIRHTTENDIKFIRDMCAAELDRRQIEAFIADAVRDTAVD